MRVNQPTCPALGYWQSLLEGSDDTAHELADHLETCTACQHTLESLVADPGVWEDAARGLQKRTLQDPTLCSVVQRLTREELPACDADLSFLQPADQPGLLGQVGPYEVEAEIGRGGMGIVLKARDLALDRVVALKMLAPHLAVSATARRRFLREGRAAA